MATIEITKAEAKEAGVFKSEMYENLKEAREATGYKVSEYVFMFLSSFIVFNLLINTKNNANL